MVKFAHIADSHLGGWRQPELLELNMQSFKRVIDICIDERVDFTLFAGDLFDSAFPPIEILKEAFSEFKRLKDAGIKSFLIAGSHDYSVSGKTFLEVLEKAGFCKICKYETMENEIILKPSTFQSIHIYGYPGKKSGLEIESLHKIKINELYQNNFRILMLHTTITEVVEGLPIESIALNELPKADYYALGHVHINYEKDLDGKKAVYGGPTFPNNFKEFETVKWGSFYIVEINGYIKVTKKEIKLKEPTLIEIEITNAIQGTEKIITELQKRNLKDKIVLLKISGEIDEGKVSDINFKEIQTMIEKAGAYSFLKNTAQLESGGETINIDFQKKDKEKLEEYMIHNYTKQNPSAFNELIIPLIEALSVEKQEDERAVSFESRLFAELEKVMNIELIEKEMGKQV